MKIYFNAQYIFYFFILNKNNRFIYKSGGNIKKMTKSKNK